MQSWRLKVAELSRAIEDKENVEKNMKLDLKTRNFEAAQLRERLVAARAFAVARTYVFESASLVEFRLLSSHTKSADPDAYLDLFRKRSRADWMERLSWISSAMRTMGVLFTRD